MTPATWRTVFLVVVLLAVLWFGYQARAVVTPLLVALMLAYILDPVVRLLERRGFSRGVASATVVVVALAALVTVVAVAATRFANEAGVFYKDVVGEPSMDAGKRDEFIRSLAASEQRSVAEVEALVRETTWNKAPLVYLDRNGDGGYQAGYAATAMVKINSALDESRFGEPLKLALGAVSKLGPKIAESAHAVLSGVVRAGSAIFEEVLGFLTVAILFPIYLFYSLVSLSRVYDVAVRHVPAGQRPRVVDILQKIHVTLSAFFRGRLITMLVKGILLLGLFAALGVPFSYVCAAFGALASLVPVVGGLAAAVPPIVLSLPDSTGGQMAGLVAGILVIEGIEGYVLIPALVGRSVGLHPLTVLVCTLVAGDLLGFFGMIVAVPLTAVLKILAAEFVLPEVRRRAGLPPLGAVVPAAPAPVAAGAVDETTKT